MKKFFFSVVLLTSLGSCQKEGISPVMQDEDPSSSINVVDSSMSPGELRATKIESDVNPRFGKPSSTYYYFKVYDPSGTLPLSVKFCEKATGTVSYLPMVRTGNYWTLSSNLFINGWYDWRYVYSSNKTNISSNAYILCNTRNSFNSSPYAIVWPFGADGSSWNNRDTWNGGQEGGWGNGWGQGAHLGSSEYYSDDWNRTNDLGRIIRSPLDGYVDAIGQYYVSGYGYSKYVAIIQKAANGNLHRFYVAHLQSYPSNLYVGKYVRAGIDQIGTLGSSGAASPHAHTNLRINNVSVPFYFNAQWWHVLLAFINLIII
ncbi:MAG: hypothetical protein ACD_80C00166G0002 [uncultured bacterium (gcode 4)]|uniref:Peptidase M23 domain-containing protein n=1 Tax=uncultured bacterium (gcode 4) TaxID=1234023 RepID=K1XHM1_9BACT|nr:MAG: hypothetical protein ACD_80C00166G0002 [uncultured bacterium (gcode 4)]